MFQKLKTEGTDGKGSGAGMFARATGRFSMFKKKNNRAERGSDASSSDSSDSDSGDDIFGMGMGMDDEGGGGGGMGGGMGGGVAWMMGGGAMGDDDEDDDESGGVNGKGKVRGRGKGKGKGKGNGKGGNKRGPAPAVERTIFVKMNASAPDIIARTNERRVKEGRLDVDESEDESEEEEDNGDVGGAEPVSGKFLAFAEEAIGTIPINPGSLSFRGMSFRSSRKSLSTAGNSKRLLRSASFKQPQSPDGSSPYLGDGGSSPPSPSILTLDGTDGGDGDGSDADAATRSSPQLQPQQEVCVKALLAELDDMTPATALVSFCPVKIRQRFHPLDNHAERTARDAMRCILVYMNQQGDMYSATTGSAPSHHHCIEVAGKMLALALCEPEDVWDEIYCKCDD